MKVDPDKIYTYAEVWGEKPKTYVCLDEGDKPIKVTTKNPAKHQSNHILDMSPVVHFNKGYIIKHSDSKIVNPPSKNPKAVANRTKGTVVRYIKKNLIKEMAIPGWEDTENDEITVTVLYEERKQGAENYTLTHMINIKK